MSVIISISLPVSFSIPISISLPVSFSIPIYISLPVSASIPPVSFSAPIPPVSFSAPIPPVPVSVAASVSPVSMAIPISGKKNKKKKRETLKTRDLLSAQNLTEGVQLYDPNHMGAYKVRLKKKPISLQISIVLTAILFSN